MVGVRGGSVLVVMCDAGCWNRRHSRRGWLGVEPSLAQVGAKAGQVQFKYDGSVGLLRQQLTDLVCTPWSR
jgi:hypothetical protein